MDQKTAPGHMGSRTQADVLGGSPLDLGASDDAPPAYGDLYNQLSLSQVGFTTNASVTGRRLIAPDQKNLLTRSF